MAQGILASKTKGTYYELNKEVLTQDYWVDGKPIFEKTIQWEGNISSGEEKLTGVSIDSNYTIVEFTNRLESASKTKFINCLFTRSLEVSTYVKNDNIMYASVTATSGGSLTKAICTIRYTK